MLNTLAACRSPSASITSAKSWSYIALSLRLTQVLLYFRTQT